VPRPDYDPLNDLHEKLEDEQKRKEREAETARLQSEQEQQRQADLKRNPYLPLTEAHAKVADDLKNTPIDKQQTQESQALQTEDPLAREEEKQARRDALNEDLIKRYRLDRIRKDDIQRELDKFDRAEREKEQREFRERQGESRDTPKQPRQQSAETGPKDNERAALGAGSDKPKAARVNWILEGDARDGSAPSMSRGSGGSGGRGGRKM
jgi:hypothetical protein